MSEPTKSRRLAREAAFQAAYQCTVGHNSISRACEDVLERREFAQEVVGFIKELADGMVTRTSELDEKFAPFLKAGWIVDRLAVIDLLALRMAVFELYHFTDLPPKVTITEAVNIAKKFGTADSGKFVNGVLSKVLEASPKKDWNPDDYPASATSELDEPEQEEAETELLTDGSVKNGDTGEAGSWIIKSDD